MATYTVPGVYVEESTGLSLSVQTGETAVPVLAFNTTEQTPDNDQASKYFGAGVTSFSSWLDVAAAINQHYKNSGTETATEKTERTSFEQGYLYQSLKLYFTNGGGHCYIAPVDKLAELVPTLDDATLLVQAGTPFDSFNTAVTALCNPLNTYFALYDSKKTAIANVTDVAAAQAVFTANAYAAVYYPWLKINETDADTRVIPPSGAVAGAYARVDRERGVWKAPANVAITGAVPAFRVSDEINGACNVPTLGGLSINVIREFRGTGPLIWGARTLKSNDDNWKFVPVRRLFSAVEKDIKAAMSIAIFEPNSQLTWAAVRSSVESYLHGLWKQGALQGDTPEQAYRVQIGLGITMTQAEIDAGNMKLRVALAAVRPAEFIVLELSQQVVPG